MASLNNIGEIPKSLKKKKRKIMKIADAVNEYLSGAECSGILFRHVGSEVVAGHSNVNHGHYHDYEIDINGFGKTINAYDAHTGVKIKDAHIHDISDGKALEMEEHEHIVDPNLQDG